MEAFAGQCTHDFFMYAAGDYIKAEFRDDRSGEVEWMWVRVESDDPARKVVFGTLVVGQRSLTFHADPGTL